MEGKQKKEVESQTAAMAKFTVCEFLEQAPPNKSKRDLDPLEEN